MKPKPTIMHSPIKRSKKLPLRIVESQTTTETTKIMEGLRSGTSYEFTRVTNNKQVKTPLKEKNKQDSKKRSYHMVENLSSKEFELNNQRKKQQKVDNLPRRSERLSFHHQDLS